MTSGDRWQWRSVIIGALIHLSVLAGVFALLLNQGELIGGGLALKIGVIIFLISGSMHVGAVYFFHRLHGKTHGGEA